MSPVVARSGLQNLDSLSMRKTLINMLLNLMNLLQDYFILASSNEVPVNFIDWNDTS